MKYVVIALGASAWRMLGSLKSWNDPMIEKMPPAQVQRVTEEIGSMVRMVRAGIADFIILTEEEGELADQIAVLVYGELIAHDTPARIRANAAVQEAYLGVPQGAA